MTKKKSKKGKNSKVQEKTVAKKSKTILKRKQLRKEKRQAKKAAKKEFVSNKYKRPPAPVDDEEIPSDEEVSVQKTPKKAEVKKQSDHDKIKKDMKELKRQQKKQRKTQLIAANEAEQKSIKMLEKNLGLKKRKSKNLPKSFLDDGLDYLLDACDSSKIAMFEKEIQEEETPGEEDDDDMDLLSEFGLDDGTSDAEDDSVMQSDCDYDEGDSTQDQDESNLEEGDTSDGEDDREDESEEGSRDGSEKEDDPEPDVLVKEDIYGRKRDADGNILKDETVTDKSKYIPPALRNKMADLEDSEQKRIALERLSRQIKGLLNRLAESNMHGIARDIERFYNSNSRNDVNNTLAGGTDVVDHCSFLMFSLQICCLALWFTRPR